MRCFHNALTVVSDSGRDDRIRTCDLCVPNAALYQTEPHLVNQLKHYNTLFRKNQVLFEKSYAKVPKSCENDEKSCAILWI